MKHFDPPADCQNGRHRARTTLAQAGQDILRSTCRSCGCALVRTRATRIWIRSGEMG
jgi:hypothetical protein